MAGTDQVSIEPFEISIEPGVVDDLLDRLARTRWPDQLPAEPWAAGTDVGYLRTLVDYWRSGFDWTAMQDRLNRFDPYLAHIDGTSIHFVHARANVDNALPLVLTHGWPGSFVEMLDLVPRLTDPMHGDESFDVVVPSLPGFMYSAPPDRRELGLFEHVAEIWHALLVRGLGYERFGSCAWDLGAAVGNRLAAAYPDALVGMYGPALWKEPGDGATSEQERVFVERRDAWGASNGAYAALQGTRPQTLSFGLTDSPVGLAAWLVEKFRDWSDCGGDVERRFSKDRLLTTIALYWVTASIGSSFWPYYVRDTTQLPFIEVPTSVLVTPADLPSPPRSWVERTCNVQQWTELPRGGHFPAIEEPDLVADDIRAFFRPLGAGSTAEER